MLAIHTRRHTYDPDEPIAPWLYAIARYKLIDHLRHTRRSGAYVRLEEAEEVLADSDHAGAESALDLDRLMGRLPAKMQRAIRSVKLEGQTVAEAAAQYGMSQSAVKVSIHRGLKAMASAVTRRAST